MVTRKNKGELTFQQRKFVNAYLETGNGTESAIRAGYSTDTAASQASRLLKNVKIKKEIERKEKEYELASLITKDFVQAEYLRLYNEEAESVNEKRMLLDALGDTIGIRKQIHVHENKENDLSNLSDEELQKQLESMQRTQTVQYKSEEEDQQEVH
ncbi:terminase small subunit [Pseudobacillus sp. 179-B 2D1 NHS]|uniref:terminase small subunit n=1 Tax=Pseudobacillus sp. 179-B 2D1 NHS TaxID=3374292 RepID=UPI00387A2924